ncbi:MAG: hypothetical protein VXY77_02980 [Pseudomonadota bacterium]|nr:hypothetical protein [Pseudomonadota bacterium]
MHNTFKVLIFLILISIIEATAGEHNVENIEGKWCGDSLAINTERNRIGKICLEFKIDKKTENRAVGRVVGYVEITYDQSFGLKRHPLEKSNQKKQVYETVSPALFSVVKLDNGSLPVSIVSLSRENRTAQFFLDTDSKIKGVVSFPPMNKNLNIAYSSTYMGSKVTDTVSKDFDIKYQSLVLQLKAVGSPV